MTLRYVISLLAGTTILATMTSCVNKTSVKTEILESVEWNVSVYKSVQFNDPLTNVSTEANYTVADTASVNERLQSVKPENLTRDWTIPNADGTIWLVAYEGEPLLTETVAVNEANSIPAYGDNIQVAFKFSDAPKWARITGKNIGRRLAVIVNGQLMNAPQVNSEITSGNCSVSIPAEKIHEYLPNLDLDKLRQ